MKNNEKEDLSSQIPSDKIVELETELEGLNRKLTGEENRHHRTLADFENYRKRIEQEREKTAINAKKELLLELLSFLDYFEQGRRQITDPAICKGLEIIQGQFADLLKRHGVRTRECLGRPFDPEFHEGLGYLETAEYPAGSVAREISPTYLLEDELLRPAEVMVARGSASRKELSEGEM